jgi:hypothetical protein
MRFGFHYYIDVSKPEVLLYTFFPDWNMVGAKSLSGFKL